MDAARRVDIALQSVKVSTKQYGFYVTKMSMDRLKLLALKAVQPMCCDFDPDGNALAKKRGGELLYEAVVDSECMLQIRL